ncbi:hypothetical protein IFM89_018207 [Coptis chinensis]|uniref:Pentatricopeptide repeat-containing protein n=1 Tax=Coptis chinensis TaxID=261450 RepID=A0A835M0G5_9MAGN|nr:hypothetical protein IFM89_018207 [Coptis chinensis]
MAEETVGFLRHSLIPFYVELSKLSSIVVVANSANRSKITSRVYSHTMRSPRLSGYSGHLRIFSHTMKGKQVHAYALKMGLDVDVTVCNTLITMYTNCLDLSAAFNIFDEMTSNLDSVSWNAILTKMSARPQPNDTC